MNFFQFLDCSFVKLIHSSEDNIKQNVYTKSFIYTCSFVHLYQI